MKTKKEVVAALRRDGWTQVVIAKTVKTVQGNVSRIIQAPEAK